MAYNVGLGACWICDIHDNAILQTHFNLPENYEILVAVAVGYYDENTNTTAQKLFQKKDEGTFD